MAASLEHARATVCAQVNACVGTLLCVPVGQMLQAGAHGTSTRASASVYLRVLTFVSMQLQLFVRAAAAIRVCVKTWTSPILAAGEAR
eukprot:2161655-Pleurochrysis_carterae.AAC.1